MGELIELSYRHFDPSVIRKLIRAGYLQSFDRHKPTAVQHALDRFQGRASRLEADWTVLEPDDPGRSA
jgi:hypothetical protein